MPVPDPPVPIDTLLATPTADAIEASIVAWLVSMGVRADLWPKSDAARWLVRAVAEKLAPFAQEIRDSVAGAWLPTAVGGWLKWLATYVYGIALNGTLFATGDVTLSNGGGAAFSGPGYQPGQVTFKNPTTGKTYKNIDAINLPSGPGTTQTIAIQADEAGTASNAAPDTITEIVASMLLVTVTNPDPVLGSDGESDDDIRALCLNSLGARSVRGPRTAYAYAIAKAKNAITGTPVNVNRWTISASSHTGQTTIVVASPDGAPISSDVDGVRTSIEAIARPGNVQVTVTAASEVAYAGTVTVYLRPKPGLTAAPVAAAVAAAITAFFEDPDRNPIGGLTADGATGLHQSGLEGAVASAYPGIFAVDATGFDVTGTLVLTPIQVAVDAVPPTNIVVRFQGT